MWSTIISGIHDSLATYDGHSTQIGEVPPFYGLGTDCIAFSVGASFPGRGL